MLKQKKCCNCKDPFTPIRSTLERYCQKSECIRVWVESEKKKAWDKKKKQAKAEMLTVQDYVKMAQQVFNSFIRKRDSGKHCISCGKQINGVRHASHYLSAGGHSNLRFNEDNVWVSCYKCNVQLSGNQIEYRKRLIEKIGIDRVQWLEDNANVVKKWTIFELKIIIEYYKNKVKTFDKN